MGQKVKIFIILTIGLLVVITLPNLLPRIFSAITIGPSHSKWKIQGNKESEFAASVLDKVSPQSPNLSLGNVEPDRLVRQLEEMQRNEIENLKSQDLVYELAENLTHLQEIFRKKGKDLEEKLKGIKNGHQKSSKMVLDRKLLILAASVQDVEVMKYRAESDEAAVLHRSLIFGNRGRNASIHDEHLFDNCAAGCEFTSNPARFNESDVVIFYAGSKAYDALKGKLHRAFPSQRFVYFFFEQPHQYAGRHLTKINKEVGINWTLHYQQDATAFWPYGTYKPRPTPYTLPTNYAQNKNRKVIWVVSNCRTPFAHREHYVAELIKYIDIDVYGRCTNQNQKYKGSVADMAAPYKFFISFENGDCDDYISEKFWRYIEQAMVVPLVLGKRNAYHQLAPPNSYIHAEQFDSPQHLAAYLHMLDKDPVLYRKYFEWRMKYVLVDVPRPYCQMCATFREKWFEPSQVDMHKYHGYNRCWVEGRSMPIQNWKDRLANLSSYKSIDPWVTINSLNSKDKPLRFT